MIMAVGVTRSAQKGRQWQSHRRCVSGPQITGPSRATSLTAVNDNPGTPARS